MNGTTGTTPPALIARTFPQRLGIFGIWVDVLGTGLAPGHGVRPNRIVRRLSELREPTARASANAFGRPESVGGF